MRLLLGGRDQSGSDTGGSGANHMVPFIRLWGGGVIRCGLRDLSFPEARAAHAQSTRGRTGMAEWDGRLAETAITLKRDHTNTLAKRLEERPGGRRRMLVALGTLVLTFMLANLAKPWIIAEVRPSVAQAAVVGSANRQLHGAAQPAAANPLCPPGPQALDQELERLGKAFPGRVGIAVARVGCPWLAGHNEQRYFPQQSVSKLWVALAVLDAADRKILQIDSKVAVTRSDLTVFNQPLRYAVLERGAATYSLRELMRYALSLSDNTANDVLLRKVGGPAAIRSMLQRKGLAGIRFGPGEKRLQSAIAGLRWQSDYSLGRSFYEARAKLPTAERVAALDAYLADPVDGAQPAGIVRAMAALAEGRLLSSAATEVMLDELSRTRSGPLRLKAGVPNGWRVYHKTGTGQELGSRATGYNDVALLRSPAGDFYAVAVMIGETRAAIPARMKLMQTVSRTVAQFDKRIVASRP